LVINGGYYISDLYQPISIIIMKTGGCDLNDLYPWIWRHRTFPTQNKCI